MTLLTLGLDDEGRLTLGRRIVTCHPVWIGIQASLGRHAEDGPGFSREDLLSIVERCAPAGANAVYPGRIQTLPGPSGDRQDTPAVVEHYLQPIYAFVNNPDA